MSIQDFCKHFTDVVEARTISPHWQCAAVISSTDRPSYPLISVSAPTQAMFVLSQPERRWEHQREYGNSIGLRVYRCRVVAPPKNSVAMKQNVSSPFKNMELLTKRELTKAHSVVVEIGRLEPHCLYIAVIDSEYRSSSLKLRVFTATAPRLRELSSPETQYLLQAQATAPEAQDRDSFDSEGGADNPMSHGMRGHAVPYDANPNDPQFQCDDVYHEWSHRGSKTDANSLTRMVQACVATCNASFRW
jgi:hypothetical protein